MSVLNVQWPQTGQVPNTTTTGSATSLPSIIFIQTNSTLTQATTAGFLNSSVAVYGSVYNNSQMALVYTTDVGDVWLRVSISTVAGVTTYSLVTPTEGSGTFSAVTLSVGSAAAPSLNFTGHTDVGLYSGATHELDVAISAAKVAGFTAAGLAVVGLISATTTISAGTNLSAGSSGVAGTVTSFPGTAANGNLQLVAVNAGGAFNTIVSNGTMGQTTTYTMGDIGATTGGLVVATSAIRMKSVAQAAVGGGAAAQTVTDTFCTSGSMVVCTWNDTTNAVTIQKAVAGNGSFIVTSSADPGASHLNYIITK